ncbi:D-methionine transport system permease protein [Anaerovirgula multivorans]|uniref:D-methionine transport system permease protein n=1 Tax=Anaerovirgula multivorans TaxID=312168 RepID=A0A239C3C1_9FIRM|nr:methionine ABC transporter permease [Anaerovirgula multivorans]SNS13914.1 D-methionine transport system permease protein [Anaerovirgula multivorans]
MWWKYFKGIIAPSILSTLRMLVFTMLFAFVLGFALSIAMVITRPDGLKPNNKVYKVLDFIVNSVRSFPIIILIVAISPITRMIVGTTIGEKAAILPLTIAATPFLARIFENAFIQVDKQLIEAARSFGASNMQIIFRVMLKEAIPTIVSGTILTTITYLSCTTMAGAVGAGGLGAVALNYGYQSFNNAVLYTSVLLLFIMVQLIQWLGDWLNKKL